LSLSKPTRSRWILLALLALGVTSMAFFGSRLRVSYRTSLTGCARDDGTGGASGLFRWADQIGVPVRPLRVPLWEAAQTLEKPTGNCALTMGNGPWSPTGEDLEPTDWLSTRDWLSRGNTLVVVTTAPETLPKTVREDLKLSALEVTGAKPAPFLGLGSVDNRPDISQAPVKSGGRLTVEREGPRWIVASTQQPGAGVSKKSPAPHATEIDLARWQLAGDQRGGVLFRIPIGQGAVYFLLDEFAWTNTGLDQGDNARVLAELLGREIRGGAFVLDEHRHGHGRVESFLTYFSNMPGSTAVMWLGGIWALLYFYGRNVRKKPVEAYVERQRRTAQEYIDAVAQLYERARAAPLVVEAVARRLRQVARSSAERPASIDSDLLRRADLYTQSAERPASPTAAIQIVRELIQLRKRIYGTRTIS
jgi:hypothetical protein